MTAASLIRPVAILARRFARRTEGIAAVEFAFLVPIMLCMFIGTVELSQAITIDRRVTHVASSTADLVARQRTVTQSTLDGYMQIITQLMSPYSATPLKLTISNVYNTTSAPTVNMVCWVYHRDNSSANAANASITANGTYTSATGGALPTGVLDATGGTSVIVVEVSYLYQPVLLFGSGNTTINGARITSYIGTSGITMRETFYLKPRLSASVQYNGAAACV
jgi:Flp pilus assembly protein TadG